MAIQFHFILPPLMSTQVYHVVQFLSSFRSHREAVGQEMPLFIPQHPPHDRNSSLIPFREESAVSTLEGTSETRDRNGLKCEDNKHTTPTPVLWRSSPHENQNANSTHKQVRFHSSTLTSLATAARSSLRAASPAGSTPDLSPVRLTKDGRRGYSAGI